ncbi:MAG: hypothetical protein ACRDH5_03905, partial [bacterium]
GTSLRQTTLEGPASFSPAGILARDVSVTTGWQSWFGTFATSRYGYVFAGRTWEWRSLSAVVRRPARR